MPSRQAAEALAERNAILAEFDKTAYGGCPPTLPPPPVAPICRNRLWHDPNSVPFACLWPVKTTSTWTTTTTNSTTKTTTTTTQTTWTLRQAFPRSLNIAYLEGGPAARHWQLTPLAGFLAYMNWKPL